MGYASGDQHFVPGGSCLVGISEPKLNATHQDLEGLVMASVDVKEGHTGPRGQRCAEKPKSQAALSGCPDLAVIARRKPEPAPVPGAHYCRWPQCLHAYPPIRLGST